MKNHDSIQVIDRQVCIPVIASTGDSNETVSPASLILVAKSEIDLKGLSAAVAAAPQDEAVVQADSFNEALAYFSKKIAGQEGSDDHKATGLYAAFESVISWLTAINDLQRSSAVMGSKLSEALKKISDAENAQLKTDSDLVNTDAATLKGDDLRNKLNADTTAFGVHETTWNNHIATIQALSESHQTLVSDISSTTKNDYGTLAQILGELTNLSQEVR